jgi:signal transduction histidine kinase
LSYDESKKEYHLKVSDTGHGIAPEILDKIFDPFFTTKPVNEGTGLGLSVIYGIVKSYHGEIHVDGQKGVGTTFKVSLPIVPNTENEKRDDS